MKTCKNTSATPNRKCRGFLNMIAAIFATACLSMGVTVATASGEDALEQGFKEPPNSAKPRVWWHWMNGNITKDGIKLDLEWMKRIGLGGFQNFDASLGTGKYVDRRLEFMTPEWKEAFSYATQLADKLGLEVAIAGSPGWSESGGPWVKPEQAMKKLVWSETRIEGGKPFAGVLPKPPSVSGPFQNKPHSELFGLVSSEKRDPEYYADSAVIAYRIPAGEATSGDQAPGVSSSGGKVDLETLSDGDLVKTVTVPIRPIGEPSWIQYEFAEARTIYGVTLAMEHPGPPITLGGLATAAELKASDDGINFHTVQSVPTVRGGLTGDPGQQTIAFPGTTARFFRLTLTRPAADDIGYAVMADFADTFGATVPERPIDYKIAEFVLHASPVVNRFEDKAGFAAAAGLIAAPTPSSMTDVIRKDDIVDLTKSMGPDGTLQWTPPGGSWMVLRLGYSLTGAKNSPASPEATGLEVDKLNRRHVADYFNTYLDMYRDATGGLTGDRGLQYLITDSWEAGAQNWTEDMPAEFKKRRGYDMTPWLPVLTGRVVETAEASDRFLWDFRATIADLVCENHYSQLAELLRSRGMGLYSESHESGRAFISDGMRVKRDATVPMGAMWTPTTGVDAEQHGSNADLRESASIAHLYGQNLVAAESLTAMTGAWAWSPEGLKPTADKALAMGLNRFIIHTSVHQPFVDMAPGFSLGPFGQWFTRLETWAEQAGPWIQYLARSSYMLQQGRFVADVAYYYGEDANVTSLFAGKAPAIPAGYNYDFINADALINMLSVKDGRLVTHGGMSYQVLALDENSRYMSLSVLRKLQRMVTEGAVVAGPRPMASPSLADDAAEFERLAAQLWGSGDGGHQVGKGRVYSGQTLEAVLKTIGVTPDFEFRKPEADTNLLYVHRTLANGEIYFVDSRNNRSQSVEVSFRVAGKVPELWHADTGEIESVSYRIVNGRTMVLLTLDPWEAVFVVFRKPAEKMSLSFDEPDTSVLKDISGPWDISYQPGRGAPARIKLEQLQSWSDSSDPGVKYFSGTATYAKTIQAPDAWFGKEKHLWLDLGSVKNIAEVFVNGQSTGILWKAPFCVDVTSVLKPGDNTLEIKVTNLWVNRLIGDQQPDTKEKYTFTTKTFYKADASLLPSGLLGPVQVMLFSHPLSGE